VETWLVALIAAGGAILGSALTGAVAFFLARLEHDAAAEGELRTALSAYGAALDRLTIQIEQLPEAHGIEEDWTTRLLGKLRTLDYLMGRLSTATIGRAAMRAVDEVIAATNRLLLVAPESVLDAMQEVSELIGRFEPGSESWRDDWRSARGGVSRAARQALDA